MQFITFGHLSIPKQNKPQTLAEGLRDDPHILRFGAQISRNITQKTRWESAIVALKRKALEVFINLPTKQKNRPHHYPGEGEQRPPDKPRLRRSPSPKP
jgi:hypothetical protein